ncbi:MAG: DUF6502 family protein, partial [Burkholderiales bacterium]
MPTPTASDAADAPDARQQALLRLLEPLARLALSQGLTLQPLGELMKLALVAAARADEPAASMSRLAVRTGVHRKDLRRIAERPVPKPTRAPAPEVFARWLADPRYLTARGRPRVLPRLAAPGDEPSFESLSESVTTDVHPRAVLDELLRLGLVEVDARDRVRLVAAAYVPAGDRADMLRVLADNVGDHLDAAVGTLRAGGERHLEQAVFSDGLSAESAEAFNRATRRAWDRIQADLMPVLQRLYDGDRARAAPATHRVRLGVYGYVAE